MIAALLRPALATQIIRMATLLMTTAMALGQIGLCLRGGKWGETVVWGARGDGSSSNLPQLQSCGCIITQHLLPAALCCSGHCCSFFLFPFLFLARKRGEGGIYLLLCIGPALNKPQKFQLRAACQWARWRARLLCDCAFVSMPTSDCKA